MTTLPDKITSGNEDAIAVPVPGEAEVVEVREGMFGVHGTGDTSGYGGLVRRIILPPATSRPYGGWFDAVADDLGGALEGGFDSAIEAVVVDRGEITFHVVRDRIVDVVRALRDEPSLRFELCSGVSGVHFP